MLFDIVDTRFDIGRIKQAELHVVGPGMKEICFDTIALTDEIIQYDGCIIACKYIDHQWIFKRVRRDRSHPNGRRTVEGIKYIMIFNGPNYLRYLLCLISRDIEIP